MEKGAENGGVPDADEKKFIDEYQLPGPNNLNEMAKKFGKKPPNTELKSLAEFTDAEVGSRNAFSTVNRSNNFVLAPDAKRYAKDVVDKLLDAWPLSGRPKIEVVIRDLPEYGAQSEDDGLLNVNLGSFAYGSGAASENEFALMIAHELGHLLMRHLEHRNVRAAIVTKLSSLASAWLNYGAVRRSTTDGHGHITLKADPVTVKRAFVAGLAVNALIGQVINLGYERKSEIEADLFAIDLARAGSYKITESEANDFITRHDNDLAIRSTKIELLKRIVLAAAADQGLKLNQKTGSGLFSAFGVWLTAQAEHIVASTFDEMSKNLTQHPNTTVRKAIMHRYLQKLDQAQGVGGGSPAQLGKRNAAELDKAKQSPHVQEALPSLKRAEEEYAAIFASAGSAQAKTASATDRGTRKDSTARPLFGTRFEGLSWELIGDVAYVAPGASEKARAMADWRQSTETPFPSVEGAHLLATANIDAEKPVRLAPVVDRITKAYGTADPVLDVAIGAAIQAGDTAKAETLAARCVDYADGSLYPRCVAQLGYDPMSKDTPATTDEGKKAFAGKSLEHSFGLLNIFRKIL